MIITLTSHSIVLCRVFFHHYGQSEIIEIDCEKEEVKKSNINMIDHNYYYGTRIFFSSNINLSIVCTRMDQVILQNEEHSLLCCISYEFSSMNNLDKVFCHVFLHLTLLYFAHLIANENIFKHSDVIHIMTEDSSFSIIVILIRKNEIK